MTSIIISMKYYALNKPFINTTDKLINTSASQLGMKKVIFKDDQIFYMKIYIYIYFMVYYMFSQQSL